MDFGQQLQQLRYFVSLRKWADVASNDPAFGSVLASAGPDRNKLGQLVGLRYPAVVANMEGFRNHPEEAHLLESITFSVMVISQHLGDGLGERALIGAGRSSTSPTGHGITRIARELLQTIADRSSESGFKFQLVGGSGATPEPIDEGSSRVGLALVFRSAGTVYPSYPTVSRFVATASGSGVASLAWRAVPDRFDFFRYHIRRAAGSTAPATSSDGDAVTTITDRTTLLYADTPSGGPATYSYSLFVEYDENHDKVSGESPSTVDATSAADTVTVAVT